MPVSYKDILALDCGAQFLNADLHIHSFGASKDVKDASMTPQAIVDSAIAQGLGAIAITDHNTDRNVAGALAYAQQHAHQLVVIPGVEITTANGHLLAYFAPERAGEVTRLLARLDLVGEPGDQNTHTAKSMADVLAEVEKLGGIGIAAHIDRPKTGFEMLADGYPNWKRDIITSPGLYGVEYDCPSHLAWYSELDEPSSAGAERSKLLEARANVPALQGRRHLAHIQGSDSHSMAQFHTTAPDKPWTRIKMAELSFEALRTALIDPTARVVARAAVPRSIPRIRPRLNRRPRWCDVPVSREEPFGNCCLQIDEPRGPIHHLNQRFGTKRTGEFDGQCVDTPIGANAALKYHAGWCWIERRGHERLAVITARGLTPGLGHSGVWIRRLNVFAAIVGVVGMLVEVGTGAGGDFGRTSDEVRHARLRWRRYPDALGRVGQYEGVGRSAPAARTRLRRGHCTSPDREETWCERTALPLA